MSAVPTQHRKPERPATRWIVGTRDRASEEALAAHLGVPEVVAHLLILRGYKDPDDAYAFLNPSLDQLHPPELLPDFEKARDAIVRAVERKDRIFVHGDYDVDGVTSAALLARWLRSLGADVIVHVPHRTKEGYGIHLNAVAAAKEAGAKLFLTCDCGVSAFEQVEAAKAAGMVVVVTDHHTIGDGLPNADAVVNPHREDSLYPWPELSGAGVAFKLGLGISTSLGHKPEHFQRAFLDLAALGTIADVMPLRGENRILARFGVDQIAASRKPGIQALLRAAKVEVTPEKPLRAVNVSFALGPRLNAAGRIDDAALALKLLMANDPVEAASLADEIETLNRARREEQERMIQRAIEQVTSQGLDQAPVVVVGGEGWHPGVIGIVAGKLVEHFRRPAFVFGVDPESGVAKASARTIPNFHLADAIRAQGDLFLSGGGHAMAAGCSFRLDDADRVRQALSAYAGERLTEDDFVPTISVDAEILPEEVTPELAEALSALEPFGQDNREPVFVARGLPLLEVKPFSNPAHARILFKTPGGGAEGVVFGFGERASRIPAGNKVDVLFCPKLDTWRGQTRLKWHVKDLAVVG